MQKLVEFECFTNNLEQYGIRKNIIISGIPDSVDNNQLEESVLKFLLTLTLMWQVMILKLVMGLVRRILELAALKQLFVLLIGNMLSKLCIIKRNIPKSKKYTFNPNNNPFFISKNLTRMNESLA